MKNPLIILCCVMVFLIAGCASPPPAIIKSSQVRTGEIKAQKKLLIASNLGHHLIRGTFSYISTELPNRLRSYGIESMVIAMTTPDALDTTDVRKEANNYGSTYVLTLTKGAGVLSQYGGLASVEVIAILTEASSGRRLWGSTILYLPMERNIVNSDEEKAVPLIDTIMSEITKIGLIGSSSASSSTAAELTTPQAATKTTESVDVRLRRIDELLEKKLITADEYKAKRKEILGNL